MILICHKDAIFHGHFRFRRIDYLTLLLLVFQVKSSVRPIAFKLRKHKKLTPTRDFLGGPVVKNLPANAKNAGSILGKGTKIPHVMGQLSLHPKTREACTP